MNTKMLLCAACVCLLPVIVMMPTNSHALDTAAAGIAVLDSETFVVTREFAGEIKLYMCSVKDGRIIIRDSTSIPYMTMEHRDLSRSSGNEVRSGGRDAPIIKCKV